MFHSSFHFLNLRSVSMACLTSAVIFVIGMSLYITVFLETVLIFGFNLISFQSNPYVSVQLNSLTIPCSNRIRITTSYWCCWSCWYLPNPWYCLGAQGACNLLPSATSLEQVQLTLGPRCLNPQHWLWCWGHSLHPISACSTLFWTIKKSSFIPHL